MKTVNASFLFFCLSIIICCSLGMKTCAQQSIDSLDYYYKLINNPKESDDLPSAYMFYDKHKKLSLSKGDTLAAIQDLRFIASIENTLGSPYESKATVVEALKLLDFLKINNVTVEARIGLYNHLGIIYKSLYDYDSALEYYDKVLEIAQSTQQINIVYNNKAFVYKELNQIEKAIIELTKSYNNSLKLDNKKDIARVLDNLGFLKSKLNEPDALPKMIQALKIRIKENDIIGTYTSYKHLTEYYKDRNDYKNALYYANKGYDVAKEINSVSYIEDALSNTMDLYNNPKVLEYKTLTDSLKKSKQINENKFALKKYNFLEQEKIAKESELKLIDSELKKAKAHQEKIIYQAIGVFVLLFSIFSYFILKSRHKEEKLQEVYDTEIRISKKIHDEVSNDVYKVMSRLQSEKEVKVEVLDDLEGIYSKTRDISKTNSQINLSEPFKNILQDLILSYKNDQLNILTRNLSKIDWKPFSKNKKASIYRVLQELLTNSKKHSDAELIVLKFSLLKSKLHIEYIDNGKGCILIKGSGLTNTENRIHTIGGTINFTTELGKGFKAKIIV